MTGDEEAGAYRRRLGKGNYFAAGLVLVKIEEECPSLSGTARHVLAVMASMTGTSERDKAAPRCFASQQAIAERAGYGVRTVRRALDELEQAGAIEHAGKVGPRLAATVRWRLTLLARLSANMTDKQSAGPRSANMADKHSANMADKHPAKMADNPSVSGAEPQRSARGGGSDAAVAAASAGAPASAAAPSTEKPSANGTRTPAERVQAALGCSPEVAQRKVDEWLSKPGLKDPFKYLNACVTDLERKARESVAENAATAKRPSDKAAKQPPKGRGTAAAKKKRAHNGPERQWEGVQRLRAGESADALAVEYGVTPARVKDWASTAKRHEPIIVMRHDEHGESRDRIAERMRIPRAEVDYVLDDPEGSKRARAARAEQVAEDERLRRRVEERKRAAEQVEQERRQWLAEQERKRAAERERLAAERSRPATPPPTPPRPVAPTPLRVVPPPVLEEKASVVVSMHAFEGEPPERIAMRTGLTLEQVRQVIASASTARRATPPAARGGYPF